MSITLRLAISCCLLALLLLAAAARAAEEPASPETESSSVLPQELPSYSEVFGAAPVPTGDELWDRYSAEVYRRALNPPDDLQDWHPALLDEDTLISWADLGADPRYWELYHYCLYGQTEYSFFELDMQNAYVQSVHDWLDGRRERAYLNREQPPAAPPWLVPYEAAVEASAVPDIAVMAGASLAPLKILRERGQASLAAELRSLEIEGTLSDITHAEWLLQDAIGRWPQPDRRSGVQLHGRRVASGPPAFLDDFSAAHPQSAWPFYVRAQYLALQGDEAGALDMLRAGNQAPVYELPYLFPLSAVAGRSSTFSDPGNLAVAGLVLDSGCTETPPGVLFEDWGLAAFVQSIVLSGDASAMQDLHVYGLRLAATRRSDPRFLFTASNLLSDLAQAWQNNAPAVEAAQQDLLDQEAALFASIPQFLYDYTPGEAVRDAQRNNHPAGYTAYFLGLPTGGLASVWPLRLGQWEGPSDAAWFNAVFAADQHYNYLPRWASLQYQRVKQDFPAPPEAGEVPPEIVEIPNNQAVLTTWALNGLAQDYAQQLSSAYTASMLAELARLDYRQLPPRPTWPLKGEGTE